MCYKLSFECSYRPDIMHYDDPRVIGGSWHEGRKCHIHDNGPYTQHYWINEDIDDKVYFSHGEAYEDDFERNPEFHGCKDWSMARDEDVLFEVDYEDLSEGQKEYLHYMLMI